VAEVLTPDDQVREAISRGATAVELRASMRATGCRSMSDQGLALVVEGVTSNDEINRVLAAEPIRGVKDSDGRRVLIVDDDRITRILVKLLLERDGYQVLEGENGQQAVEIAHREHPDLIIIDLMMPEMDGYQAIEKIRLELGADDYVIKPFEAPVLRSRVRATLRRMQRGAVAAA
jgi:CheY-like chemotaxis protein